MAVGKVRANAPAEPVVSANGTDGSATDPRIATFFNAAGTNESYATPCLVHNLTGNGNAIRVKINSSTTGFTRATELGYLSINDGFSVDVSMGGLVQVRTVSWITTDGGDDLDDVQVIGWLP